MTFLRKHRVADKSCCTVKMTKSFRPPFLKGGAVEGAEPSSTSAEGDTPQSGVSFCQTVSVIERNYYAGIILAVQNVILIFIIALCTAFFLCTFGIKEKADSGFVQFCKYAFFE